MNEMYIKVVYWRIIFLYYDILFS